jgi:hypothetical protein
LKIHYFCSFANFIAYRFMLAFIMLISYQVCLVWKSFLKSCPHDQFMLNYGLSTKLYIARLFGTSSKSGNPNLTRQVWSLHRTCPIPLGIKPFDRPLTPHLDSFLLQASPTSALGDSKVIWGFPLICLVIPRGFHPLSSSDPVSIGFALV